MPKCVDRRVSASKVLDAARFPMLRVQPVLLACLAAVLVLTIATQLVHAAPNFAIDTSDGQQCTDAGSDLGTVNYFTDLDGGTFGTGTGAADEFQATNDYAGQISGGTWKNTFSGFTYGDYAIISNMVARRNTFQHFGDIHDPVNGITGRFFVSDPNVTSSPTFSTTLTNLVVGRGYEVSFWATNSEPPTAAANQISVLADSVEIFNTGPLPTTVAQATWKKYSFVYTHTGVAGASITFDIRATAVGEGGNDFWLDEIRVVDCFKVKARDDISVPINGGIGSVSAIDIYADNGAGVDTLNGIATSVNGTDITVTAAATPVSTGDPVPSLNIATGIVSVPIGTPAATYTIVYEICDEIITADCSSATVTVPVFAPSPSLEVTKLADVSGLSTNPIVGENVSFPITVQNTGDVELTGVALTDALSRMGGGALVLSSGPSFVSATSASSEGTLIVGETASYAATYVITQLDIDAGGIANSVTATGSSFGNTDDVSDVSDNGVDSDGNTTDDPTLVLLAASPSLAMVKTAGDATLRNVGDVITYTYLVTNDGNVTITGISVDDVHNAAGPKVLPGGEVLATPGGVAVSATTSDSGVGGTWDSLGPGDSIAFTGTYTVLQADVDSLQ